MKDLIKYNILFFTMETFIIMGSVCSIIGKGKNGVLQIISVISALVALVLCIILICNWKKMRKIIKHAKEENNINE